MTIDLEDLRRKAEAATPGPWDYSPSYYGSGAAVHGPTDVICEGLDTEMKFIAAANPATILALLDEIKQARRKAIDQCADHCFRHALNRLHLDDVDAFGIAEAIRALINKEPA